jgi:DNA-binding NtrC family response regulator
MSPELKIEVIPLTEVPSNGQVHGAAPLRPVVLVVDDEHVIADSLSVILSKSGFSVITAYDGESALELANVVPPELLLSDVMMGPGMDGIELATTLIKAYPDCKVLLFSGHAATRDLLDKARGDGHNFTLLSKPLHPSDLLERIKNSLADPIASREAQVRSGHSTSERMGAPE